MLSFEYRLKFSISQKMILISSELWNLNIIDSLINVYTYIKNLINSHFRRQCILVMFLVHLEKKISKYIYSLLNLFLHPFLKGIVFWRFLRWNYWNYKNILCIYYCLILDLIHKFLVHFTLLWYAYVCVFLRLNSYWVF